jgi:hypothetical protein
MITVEETGPFGIASVREVLLPVSPGLPLYSQIRDGDTKYFMRLSEAIPQAVEVESPMKGTCQQFFSRSHYVLSTI